MFQFIFKVRELTDEQLNHERDLIIATLEAMRSHPFPIIQCSSFTALYRKLYIIDEELAHWSRNRD